MSDHLEADGNYLPDSLEIIEAGQEMGPNACSGPCNPLHEALINFWLNGVHDDEAGEVDRGGHVFRVGRHVIETDGQGFTRLHSYGTESAAQELVDYVADQTPSDD